MTNNGNLQVIEFDVPGGEVRGKNGRSNLAVAMSFHLYPHTKFFGQCYFTLRLIREVEPCPALTKINQPVCQKKHI